MGASYLSDKSFRKPIVVLAAALLSWVLFALLQTAGAESRPGPIAPATTQTSEHDPELWKAQLAEVSDVLLSYSRAIRAVVKLITPSVVHLDAVGGEMPGGVGDPRRRQEESGAGILIRLDGKDYVLTNRHVVAKATPRSIKIRLFDGRVIRPEALWMDADTDIALLRIKADDLRPAEIGNSDELEIGDFVVAVGSPFGLRHTVTFGIVSAVRRRGLQLGHAGLRVQDFIQTDAAINPGNSGGPLVNLKGQVVGINTAIASNSGGSEGIGFAIPINLALRVANQLAQKGAATWGYLGVNLDDSFDGESAEQLGLSRFAGALVAQVVPGSPAAAGGLRPGDVILRFGGVWVEDDDHLIYLVSLSTPGESVPIAIWRNGQELEMTVQIGERPSRSMP
jgi:serine protease Do